MIETDFILEQPLFTGPHAIRMETELTRMAERTLSRWVADSDRKLEAVLERAVRQLTEQLTREVIGQLIGQSTQAGGQGLLSFSGDGAPNATRLSNMLANRLSDWLVDELYPRRTRIHTQETDRSRAAESAFHHSRSQQASATTRDAARGQRNL